MKPIVIDGLSKIYRGKWGKPVAALRELTLSVDAGEIVGFLGPNGAGKSTTIKTLVGLIRPTQGEVALFGQPVNDVSARRRIGYLPENPSFYEFLTAREYLVLVSRVFGLSGARQLREVERILELVDLTGAAGRPLRGYSKGMVQRLALAQTLVHDPDLYILDEPMSGLDPLGRVLVKNVMLDLKRRGKTVFFSTHVTADIEAVCDRVAVVTGGQLRSLSEVRDILDKGIEGYVVQVANYPVDENVPDVRVISAGVCELYVSRQELPEFIVRIAQAGGEVLRIEPRQRNLEQFFLELVNRQ